MPSIGNAVQRLWDQGVADYRTQLLASVPRADDLLDVGCDDGAWSTQVARAVGAQAVAGIEIVPAAREAAIERGVDARPGDLEERWPFEDESFDLVHANQVIEHVKRLDHFVEQTHRVLRPGGTAVVCTENLSAWHNVAAAALGYMPFSLTNISEKGPVGNRFALHNGEENSRESWQHIHVVTLDGLVHIFELHGFTVVKRFGAGYYPAFGRAGRWLARRDPRHAHFIGIVATA